MKIKRMLLEQAEKAGLEIVNRALHSSSSLIHDVSVNHRGIEILVSEQLLYGADIVA